MRKLLSDLFDGGRMTDAESTDWADRENIESFDADTQAFLLLEFETLREMRSTLGNIVASEINVYVAIVGAAFVALAFLDEVLPDDHTLVRTIALGILLVVFILGWAMYFRVVESRITIVQYARSLNRVRNYYIKRNTELVKFISPNIYDNVPKFGSVGSAPPKLGALLANTGMIATINSSSCAAMGGIVCSILDMANIWIVVAVVFLCFIGSTATHNIYQTRKYAHAEKVWDSFHPRPSKK